KPRASSGPPGDGAARLVIVDETPRLYRELAEWWPVLPAPHEDPEEAEDYRRLLVESSGGEAREVLELGSGGGNNASHLKAHFGLTLVDRSQQMLAVSRRLNPECEHVEGDMRSVRLGRTFDAVFVHDAIAYMTTEDDLRAVFATRSSTADRAGSRSSSPTR